jgi:hypothetical protein
VTEAVVGVVTAEAVAVKVADVEPAAMVTDAGTDKAAAEDESVTVAPSTGAAEVRTAVQVEVAGVVIVAGLHAKEEIVTSFGFSVNEADFVTPP